MAKKWKRRVDLNMIFYLISLVTFAILNVFYTYQMRNGNSQNSTSQFIFADNFPQFTFPSIAMQFTACNLQLMIIVGLCFDQNQSWTSKFFNSSLMQFFGKISMALYLVHLPLIDWIKLVINGPVQWENGRIQNQVFYPFYCIFIHLVLSLIFASILTLFLEEPVKNCLQKKQAKNDIELKGNQNKAFVG